MTPESQLSTDHEDAVPGDGAEVGGLDTGPLRLRSPRPVTKHDVEAADGDLRGPGAVHQPHGGQGGRVVTHPAHQAAHPHWTLRYMVWRPIQNLHFVIENTNMERLNNNDLICCEP